MWRLDRALAVSRRLGQRKRWAGNIGSDDVDRGDPVHDLAARDPAVALWWRVLSPARAYVPVPGPFGPFFSETVPSLSSDCTGEPFESSLPEPTRSTCMDEFLVATPQARRCMNHPPPSAFIISRVVRSRTGPSSTRVSRRMRAQCIAFTVCVCRVGVGAVPCPA